MLIIALVVFGMGIVLFTKFFQEAENIKQNLDDQTRRELESKMMSSSEKIVIYPTSITVKKGKSGVIGVGILNIGGSSTFNIDSEYQACYNRNGEEITTGCGPTGSPADPLGLLDSREVNIPLNKREIASVPIKVKSGSASAKYSVLITVEQDGSSSKHLVYIDVP